ncbi:MAG TPA: Ig-like domain-containing protein, partial [Nocardioidaceae bacterium]|nr:Ig-like domain-containing protein [Nocardioidaceae bacterium]
MSSAANQNPSQVETLQADLHARFSGDQETVLLTETGADTGVFEGSIPAALEPGAPGNGRLEETNGGPPAYAPEEVTAVLPPAMAVAHTVGGRIAFVDEFGRETTTVPLGGPVRLRAVFPAANNPQYQDGMFLQLQLAGDDEGVVLEETGLDTGIFEGSIDSFGAAPIPNNQRLEGAVGQTVTVLLPIFNTDRYIQARAVFTDGSTGGYRVSFLDASGAVTHSFGEGSRVYVRLEDPNQNDPNAIERLNVQLDSTSGDQELLAVEETGAGTGIYEGSILLDAGAAAADDGRLQARQGDEITADRQGTQSPAPVRASIVEAGRPPGLELLNLRGQSVTTYSLRSTIYVRVVDPSRIAFTVPVTLRSLANGDVETFDAQAVDRGVYEVTLPSTDTAGVPGDHKLNVGAGGEIEATSGAFTARATFLSNQVPVAVLDRVFTSPGQPVTFDALANDSDPEGEPLVIAAVSQGGVGTAVLNPDGTLTYTPEAGFTGIAGFGYVAVDPQGGEAFGTVNVFVTNKRPPMANDDYGSMNRGGSLTLDVLANDTDPDGDTLRVAQVSGPVVINPDQTVTYTPRPTFTGLDSFDYVVSDGGGAPVTGHVHIVVNGPPAANADTATVAEDQVARIDVLANDTDDQSLGFLRVTSVTQGLHGAVAIDADRTVSYTPAPNFNGADSFTYTITDGYNSTSTATVTVAVTPVNDAPVAAADTAAVAEDGSVDVAVLSN